MPESTESTWLQRNAKWLTPEQTTAPDAAPDPTAWLAKNRQYLESAQEPADLIDPAVEAASQAAEPQLDQPGPLRGNAPMGDAEQALATQQAHADRERRGRTLPRSLARTLTRNQALAEDSPEDAARLGINPQDNFASVKHRLAQIGKPIATTIDILASNLDRAIQPILGGWMAAVKHQDPIKGAIDASNYGPLESHLAKRISASDIYKQMGWTDSYNFGPFVTRIAGAVATAGASEVYPTLAGKPKIDWAKYAPEMNTRGAAGLVTEGFIDPITRLSIGPRKGAAQMFVSGKFLNTEGNALFGTLKQASWLVKDPRIEKWLAAKGAPQLMSALEDAQPMIAELLANPSRAAVLAARPKLDPLFRSINKLIAEEIPISATRKTAQPMFTDITGAFPYESVSRSMTTNAPAQIAMEQVLQQAEAEGRRLADKGGLKFGGVTIVPGKPVTDFSKAAAAKLHESIEASGRRIGSLKPLRAIGSNIEGIPTQFNQLADKIGYAFSTTWKLPPRFAREYKSLFLGSIKGGESEIHRRVLQLLRGTSEADRISITRAIDSEAIKSLPPELAERATHINYLLDEAWSSLVNRGIVDPKLKRANYIYHFVKNPRVLETLYAQDELRNVVRRFRDPSTYQRLFDTIAEGEAWRGPRGERLDYELDVAKLLAMRLTNANRAIVEHDFLHHVVSQWGPPEFIKTAAGRTPLAAADAAEAQRIAVSANKFFGDLLKDAYRAGEHPPKMRELLRSAGVGPDLIADATHYPEIAQRLAFEGGMAQDKKLLRELPADLQREFFRQRFMKARYQARELSNVERAYAEFKDLWPKGESGSPLANSFGLPRPLPGDGKWVTTIIPGIGAPLLPTRVAHKVQEALKSRALFTQHGEILMEGLRAYDKVLNATRATSYAIWPSSHFRNFYTNPMQSAFDLGLRVLDPKGHYDAMQVLRGNRAHVITNSLGESISAEQFRRMHVGAGGFVQFKQTLNYGGVSAASAVARDTANDLSAARFINYMHWAVALGNTIENEARMFHTLSLWKDGIPIHQAVARMEHFLFDYATGLTPFEQQYLKRVMLFPSWPRFNIPLQLEQAAKNPRYLLFYTRALEEMRKDKDAPERSMVERTLMPAQIRSQWGVRVGEGDVKQMSRWLTALDMPQTDLNAFDQGDFGKTLDWWEGQVFAGEALGDLLTWARSGERQLSPEGGTSSSFEALKLLEHTKLWDWLALHRKFDRKAGREVIWTDNKARLQFLIALTAMGRPLREVSRFMTPGDSFYLKLAHFTTGASTFEFNPNEAAASQYETVMGDALKQGQDDRRQLGMNLLRQGGQPTPEDIQSP